MKFIKKFLEIFVFSIISIICLIVILQNVFLKNSSIGGVRSYVIASNSMYPVLKYGDVILVKDIDFEDIKIGDIITFKGKTGTIKDKIITHEVVDIITDEDGDKLLKTKGRANTGFDPYVDRSQVYGKLYYKFIVISFISKIVRNDYGFIFLVLIPFVVLFILEIYNLYKESQRKKLEELVKEQLKELEKIDKNNKKRMDIEKTIFVQLDEIEKAKKDYKKINKLEQTVTIPLEDIKKEIEKLKDESKTNESVLNDETVCIESKNLQKAIKKEFKLKNKKLAHKSKE